MRKSLLVALLLCLSWVNAETPKDTLVFACCTDGIDTLDPEGAYDSVSGGAREHLRNALYL